MFGIVKHIDINTIMMGELFSAGIAPGSDPAFRNECCRPAALDADPMGHFLVFRNDLAMNPFCASLRIPAKLAIFFLDLQGRMLLLTHLRNLIPFLTKRNAVCEPGS